jgi:hypothetical protein
MSNVFKNSIVTIAAMGSHDSNGRCFIPDDSRKSARIEYKQTDEQEGCVYVDAIGFLIFLGWLLMGVASKLSPY